MAEWIKVLLEKLESAAGKDKPASTETPSTLQPFIDSLKEQLQRSEHKGEESPPDLPSS